MSKRIVVGITCAALAALFPWGARAQAAGDCATLEDLRIEDTNLLSSTVVPAANDLPEYCRVQGYVRPAINFEIRLPTTTWNGKFYMVGCGAQCGRVLADRPGFNNAMNHGLRRNYAAATMDGGHWGSEIWDRRWTEVKDPIARFDYEQRAVTETARVSKQVIAAYYGRSPEKSYFAGCSNGGRQANMEAWKYPEDFDGIISGCPSLYLWRANTAWAWNVKANTGPDGKNVLAFSKLPMIANAVYDACAGEDGLIEDPRRCGFKPASLQCKGADAPDCLTAAEVQTLEKWYAGPSNSSGEQIFPGVPLGSEPYWSFWLSGEDEETWRGDKEAIQHTLRFYGFAGDPGVQYDVINFDFDKDPQVLAQTYVNREASGTDLSAFKGRGGKLLIYHGLADVASSDATRQWYETLTKEMGGEAATMEFARLFLVPGMDHCGVLSGPGVDQTGFDPLPALEKWVEEGVPPESIVMTKADEDGKTEWTRPVCVYPIIAKYKGSGDLKDTASWTCAGPGA
jgi:Tannase and feruloyl esterase